MKHVSHLVRALLVSIALVPVPSRARPATAPNFESLRNQWIQKLESQDLEGPQSLYAKDATFTNPDGAHVNGLALRDLYKEVFGSFHAKILMTPRSHAVSGSLAYEAGSYAEDLTRIGTGEEKHIRGDFLTVYRQADSGRWLIIEQVWTEAASK